MTPETAILLILLAGGEIQETPFTDEYQCVKAAAKASEKGLQAYCIIPAPDKIEIMLDYPDER